MDQVQQAIEQLKKFPKVWEKLLKWEVENLKIAQKKVVEGIEEEYELPEIPIEMVENILGIAYTSAPSFIYEFFDPQEIIILVNKSSQGWFVGINQKTLPAFYATRKEAEKAGFEQALQDLENKLT